MSKIKRIVRTYVNGMYSDVYTVIYESGFKRRFDIRDNGSQMINQHFEFIMNAHVRPVYHKQYGIHRYDVFEL